MVLLIIGILLALIMFISLSLLKTYKRIPIKELKRQARAGDEIAKMFCRPASYGMSLDILLWFIAALSTSLLIVLIVRNTAWPIAAVVCLAIVLFAFAWLPETQLTRTGVKIAQYSAPALHWILDVCQPVLSAVAKFLKRGKPISVHTGLFSKQDLLDLIDQQKVQIDNRITKEELYIAAHALKFGDKKVGEIMTPKRKVKMVTTTDMVGPVLMDELHDSGHSRFPVFQDNETNIVGTLYLRDMLGAKAGGFVKNIMRKDVYYVHEEQPLARVLDAFLKTHHHMFLVVNNFEEIVGIVTIEDIVEQVIGKQIIDEFDQYDDLRAVAHMEAQKAHKSQSEVVQSSEEESTQKEEEKSESSKS